MPKIPQVKPKALIKALEKMGFVVRRQRGSHVILVNETANRQVVVPVHSKPLKKGTIAAILRQAEVSLNDLDV